MKLTRKLAGVVAGGGAVALVAGTIAYSGGIGAAFTDKAEADANIAVGTFACQLSSDNADVKIKDKKHTATIKMGEVLSSAPDSRVAEIKLTNTGSIPMTATWSPVDTSGTTTVHIDALPSPANMYLAPGATQVFEIGFSWTSTLDGDDLGNKAFASYSVDCLETPNTAIALEYERDASGSWNSNGEIDLSSPGNIGVSSAPWNVTHVWITNAGNTLPESRPAFTMVGGFDEAPIFHIGLSNSDGTVTGFIQMYPSNNPASPYATIVDRSDNSKLTWGAHSWDDIKTFASDHGLTVVTAAQILFNPASATDSTITCIQYNDNQLLGLSC